MPDDISGDSVKQAKADGQVPPSPPNPTITQSLKPPTHGDPTSAPAQPVSGQPQAPNLAELQERISRVDRWMIRLTGAIALFTLALVVVGVFQWNAMRGQLREMKSSGATASDQIWRAIGNMNWMARTTDGSLYQTQRAITTSERQNRVVIETMAEQNRPWIRFTEFKTRESAPAFLALTFQTVPFNAAYRQMTIQTVFTFENIGRTVAINTELNYEVFLPQWTAAAQIQTGAPSPDLSVRVFAEQRRFCGGISKVKPDPAYPKATLFPNVPFTRNGGVSVPIRPEMVNQVAGGSKNGYLVPYVIGCVNYQFSPLDKIYQTGFIYSLTKNVNGVGSRFFEIGQDVSMANLRLDRDSQGDYAK